MFRTEFRRRLFVPLKAYPLLLAQGDGSCRQDSLRPDMALVTSCGCSRSVPKLIHSLTSLLAFFITGARIPLRWSLEEPPRWSRGFGAGLEVRGMQKTAVTLHAPFVLRAPGLPFNLLNEFRGAVDQDKLWALLENEQFLDCLATMHHRALPSLDSRRKKYKPGKRPSDVRRAELTLYRYLARFCSRNDTTGTAGTVSWLGSEPQSGQAAVKKFVYPSPRYVELMANRLAWGELRDQAYVTANSYIRWHPMNSDSRPAAAQTFGAGAASVERAEP